MSKLRTNVLLQPVMPDPQQGEALLSHVAARLSAQIPRYLQTFLDTDIRIEASTAAEPFGEWSKPGAYSYQIGSSAILIVRVDECLADTLLEYQLGGRSPCSIQPDRRPGRAITSLMRSIADVVSIAVVDKWPGGGAASFAAIDDGMQPARADDRVATIALAVSAAGTEIGQIGLAFPMEGLARVSSPPATPRDGDWCAKMRDSVLAARLPVRAILARPAFPAAVVMRLAVGDVLPISKPEFVPLYSGDHVVGNGQLIDIAGRTAIQFQTTESCHD